MGDKLQLGKSSTGEVLIAQNFIVSDKQRANTSLDFMGEEEPQIENLFNLMHEAQESFLCTKRKTQITTPVKEVLQK